MLKHNAVLVTILNKSINKYKHLLWDSPIIEANSLIVFKIFNKFKRIENNILYLYIKYYLIIYHNFLLRSCYKLKFLIFFYL